MIRLAHILVMAVVTSATSSIAERSQSPARLNTPDVCPDQPPEPEWMREMGPRDAHKRLLIQQIYRAESMQRIVEAQSCECATRYPPWDAAEAEYRDRYATGEYWDIVEATSESRRLANELRKIAKPICEAAGNW
ncbi:hypothetical protein OB2597_18227 [Pseudooceanicola batsensis HTCC2597]|uniref:Secreted protein n=1 Tax=Pseudooceanicola batsensis (strain ATCC BAA-863 / DSM 15984 / KCTC 12145 / HTCC2597) TaxID=252305 RepID=A3U049_PSEBH|nr:hypothetical protein [Pseudooceanicola batsensis]EAQ02680.1 hypothetical protein OB2597_18227 [Pseudooceanicola batsensis HTCC2597]